MRALAFVLALGASLLNIPGVRAEDTVLLFEDGALRPALCGALRIQLTDVADVECLRGEATDALADRIEYSVREVRRRKARLGVLLERDPDPRRVRMLLVSEREEQALLATERIEDRPAPDVDRSLAIKVRDTLETLRAVEQTVSAPEPLAAALVEPAPRIQPLREAERWRALLEVGAALALGAHTRGAGLLAMGARVERPAWYGELVLAGQLSSALQRSSTAGRVREEEWGVSLATRLGKQWPRFALGGLLGLEVVRAEAEGSTRDGSRGREVFALARIGLGVDLRVTLLRGPAPVSLRLAPTLQVDPAAQRLQVDRQTTLELGRARLWLPLSLLVELPVPGGEG